MIKLLLTIASLMLTNDFAHAEDVSYDSDSSLSDSSDTSVVENTNDKKKGKSSKAVDSTQAPSKNPFAGKPAEVKEQGVGKRVAPKNADAALNQSQGVTKGVNQNQGLTTAPKAQGTNLVKRQISDRPVNQNQVSSNALRAQSQSLTMNQTFKKNASNMLPHPQQQNGLAHAKTDAKTDAIKTPITKSAPVVTTPPSGKKPVTPGEKKPVKKPVTPPSGKKPVTPPPVTSPSFKDKKTVSLSKIEECKNLIKNKGDIKKIDAIYNGLKKEDKDSFNSWKKAYYKEQVIGKYTEKVGKLNNDAINKNGILKKNLTTLAKFEVVLYAIDNDPYMLKLAKGEKLTKSEKKHLNDVLGQIDLKSEDIKRIYKDTNKDVSASVAKFFKDNWAFLSTAERKAFIEVHNDDPVLTGKLQDLDKQLSQESIKAKKAEEEKKKQEEEAKKEKEEAEKKKQEEEAKKKQEEEAKKAAEEKKKQEEAAKKAAESRDLVLIGTVITSDSGSNKVSMKDAKERVQKRISEREKAVLSKIKDNKMVYQKMANFVLDNLSVGKFNKLSVKDQNKVIAIAQLILTDTKMKVQVEGINNRKQFSELVDTKLNTLQDKSWINIKIKDEKTTVSDKLSSLLNSVGFYSTLWGYYDSYGNGTSVTSNEEWRYFGSESLIPDDTLSADQNFKNLLAVVDDKMLIRSSSEEKIVEQAKLKSIHEQEKERRVSKYKDLINDELDKARKAVKTDIKELRGYGLEAMLLHSYKTVGDNKCELPEGNEYYDEMKRLTGKDKPTLHDLYEAVKELNHERELGVIHGHNEHLMEGYDALYQKVADVLHDTIDEYNKVLGRTQILFGFEKIGPSCTEVQGHIDELSSEILAGGTEQHTSLSAFLEASTSLVRVGGQEQAKAFVEAALLTKDSSIIAHAISMLDDKTFKAINKLWEEYAGENKGGLASYGGTFEKFMQEKENYDKVVKVLEGSGVKFHDDFIIGIKGEENLQDMIERTKEKNYLEHGINAYEHSNLETFRSNTRKKTAEETK